MSEVADLLRGTASLLWVMFAIVLAFILRRILVLRGASLKSLGIGPSGVIMEFAEAKIDEAARKDIKAASDEETAYFIGAAAKRSVLGRIQRNADLLSRARILWADDHPEGNAPIIELLRRFGASVETPRSNAEAMALMRTSRYDVVISDVARDDEGSNSALKGIDLADQVFEHWGQRILLFTGRFSPTTLPGANCQTRLDLAARVQRTVFGFTNRVDEALHYILDVLERIEG